MLQGVVLIPARLTSPRASRRWLEASVKPSVKPKTYAGYESIVRVRVVPRIGQIILSKVVPLVLQGIYSDLQAAGLSNRSLRHTHQALHCAFRQAVRWGLRRSNPCDAVTPLQPKRAGMHVLTEAQVGTLLDSSRGQRAHALYVLAVTTGMRQGELLGLRWEDGDLDAGRLRVRRAFQRQRGRGLVFIEPKTSHSRRQIILGQRTIHALREHRRRQLERV